MDNAYYRRTIVKELDARGWDFSISVTNKQNKAAALKRLSPTAIWMPLREANDDANAEAAEEVADFWYKPSKWHRMMRYVVVRRHRAK